MEKKGNGDTFRTVYFVWVGLVLSSLRFRLQNTTVPPVPSGGTVATVPLSGSHTLAPIGRTALRACATGSHPKVTPRDGSPSRRATHIDRTRAHGRTRADVPWDGRDAHGTAHHGTARERTHTSLTSSLRPARWPTIGLTRLHDRLPLLAASACRARAQLKLPPARLMQDISRAGWTAAIVGLGAKPYARTAAATRPLLPATTT